MQKSLPKKKTNKTRNIAETSRIAGGNNMLQGRIRSIQAQIYQLSFEENIKFDKEAVLILNNMGVMMEKVAEVADKTAKKKIKDLKELKELMNKKEEKHVNPSKNPAGSWPFPGSN